MPDRKWTQAAWMAIGAAALTPPNAMLSFLTDRLAGRGGEYGLLLPVLAVLIGSTAIVLAVIALYRFRELLNERYGYHGIDALVTFSIIAIVCMGVAAAAGRLTIAVGGGIDSEMARTALLFVTPVILLQVATGVVSIIVGLKLYSLDSDLQSLIRPYAVLSIVGGACFTMVILAPVGLMVLVAEYIVLALTFFRANETEPTVDFV